MSTQLISQDFLSITVDTTVTSVSFHTALFNQESWNRLYNDYKDFHRVSFNERHNTVKCVFPLSDNNHRIIFNKEIEKRGANAMNRFSVG